MSCRVRRKGYDLDKKERQGKKPFHILEKRRIVMDFVYIGLVAGLFILSWFFIKLAERV
jgi:hypothetical protein